MTPCTLGSVMYVQCSALW